MNSPIEHDPNFQDEQVARHNNFSINELFALIPEYDGNQILLNAFLNSCETALDIAVGNQKFLLIVHIKNKLRGNASQLINSRDVNNWNEIKVLLTTHFGDTRDLNSLIYDLNRLKQQPNESPLTFIHRINSHNAKLHSSINSQIHLSNLQKLSQHELVDKMCLDTLLTGLDSKIGQIIRASNPQDLVEAALRIKRELQLSYFETSRSDHNYKTKNFNNNIQKKVACNICKRPGHYANNCRNKNSNQFNRNQNQRNDNNHSNYSNKNFTQRHNENLNRSSFNQRQSNEHNKQSNYQFNRNSNQSKTLNHLNELEEGILGNSLPSTSRAQHEQQQLATPEKLHSRMQNLKL